MTSYLYKMLFTVSNVVSTICGCLLAVITFLRYCFLELAVFRLKILSFRANQKTRK